MARKPYHRYTLANGLEVILYPPPISNSSTGLDNRTYNGYSSSTMTTVSITELKIRPSKIITRSSNHPIAVENRNKITAHLENYIDKTAISQTDFSKGKDFEKVARDLGI